MKTFIWQGIYRVTDRYHSGGSILVVAVDLEQARYWLREAKKENPYWYEGCPEEDGPREIPLVPTDCAAYTAAPSYVLNAGNEDSGRVLIFPNSGCC